MLKIGNVSLNPEAFKDYSKEQFFVEYTGKLDTDKDVVWGLICEVNRLNKVVLPAELGELLELKKVSNESIDSTGKQNKRNKGR